MFDFQSVSVEKFKHLRYKKNSKFLTVNKPQKWTREKNLFLFFFFVLFYFLSIYMAMFIQWLVGACTHTLVNVYSPKKFDDRSKWNLPKYVICHEKILNSFSSTDSPASIYTPFARSVPRSFLKHLIFENGFFFVFVRSEKGAIYLEMRFYNTRKKYMKFCLTEPYRKPHCRPEKIWFFVC